jgi:hypothetical protein
LTARRFTDESRFQATSWAAATGASSPCWKACRARETKQPTLAATIRVRPRLALPDIDHCGRRDFESLTASRMIAVSLSSHAMVDARGGDSGRRLDGDRCDCGKQLPGPRRGGPPSRVASAADRHTRGPEAKADQLPRDRRSTRPVTALDAVAVAVVVAAVVAMAIWFLFFSGHDAVLLSNSGLKIKQRRSCGRFCLHTGRS